MTLTAASLRRLAKLLPADRSQAVMAMQDDHRRAIAELAAVRRGALHEMRAGGLSVAEIAAELGISRQEAHRIGSPWPQAN